MCLLVFFSLVCKAQNFPVPIPVRADHLIPIEISLKTTKSDAQRAVLQLQEANILYNRPQKKIADLTEALNSAMKAAILAQKHGNQRVYNDALYMAALANADLGPLARAATLLPRLNDTTRTNALLLLAHHYWWRFDDDKAYDYRAALTYAEEALRISETSNNIYKTLLTRRIIAQIHGSLRNPSAGTEFLNVIKSYKALRYPYMHYVYSQYAYFLTNTGKQNEAVNYSLAALKSVQATKDSAAAGDVNLFHSIIIAENDMFSESMPYAFTAIDYYQKFPGLVSVSDPFLPLVISHAMRKMGDNDRSLAYIHATMKKYPPQSLDERLLYMSMLGHTYREKKMYDSAAFFFNNAYRIARANHSSTFRATRDVGHLYLELENYDVARKYLYESLNFPAVMYSSAETKQLRFEMFMADSATGHYKAALKDMSKFKDIDNAELRAATNKHIRELEAKYENALKEVEIRKASDHIKLLGQQNAVQSLRISHNKFITTIMIVGLLTAAFIIVTIFYFYRQKTTQSLKISEQAETIMKKNDLLEQVLREKDWLLKEVNHRVKNNLHTILSLLEAQAQNLKDDALEAIETSQHRIFAVTLIHKKLYTNDMADLIDMSVYMTELIAYLKEGFGEPQNIRIVTDIQPMELLASRAISLGLILNEGLTNAMRYAFADGRNGIIWVSLRATEDRIHLNITDNGMGFPLKINTSEPHMGTAIMRGLVDEMDGEITIDGSKGTEINVSFERIIQLPHYPLEAV